MQQNRAAYPKISSVTKGMAIMDKNHQIGADAAIHGPTPPHNASMFLSAGARVLKVLYGWQERIDERRELDRIE